MCVTGISVHLGTQGVVIMCQLYGGGNGLLDVLECACVGVIPVESGKENLRASGSSTIAREFYALVQKRL